MKIRYYLDPETGFPHIYKHNVLESEVEEVLFKPGEDRVGHKGSRIALGQTDTGRYLKVIYVQEPVKKGIFVIIAYELSGKPLLAYKRRRRKKI